SLSKEFKDALKDEYFELYVKDLLELAELQSENYNQQKPLTLNEKYTRKDFCRLLNWDHDESSTMYGYKQKHGTLPIFITYNKGEDVSASISYGDKFLDSHILRWFTRRSEERRVGRERR